MRIFTEQALKEYAENHPDSKVALQEWTTIVKRSKWTCFADIKKTFNSVDNVREYRERLPRLCRRRCNDIYTCPEFQILRPADIPR